MGKEFLTFGKTEVEKNKLYHHKTLIFLKDVDIEKVLISSKIYLGRKTYKYFIGHLFNYHKVNPLQKMLPKTNAYVKSYDGQTK